MCNKIRVVLPQKMDLVVGDLFQLFYRGVVEAPNPYCFNIVAECDVGRDFPRYYEYLPEKEGTHKLTISVYGVDKALLGRGETILNVVMPQKPKQEKTILCIGDSLTAGGQWVGEVNRRLSACSGEPSGLGFDAFRFVGSCSANDVHFEAHGGWRWDCYTTIKRLAIWVECNHDKTEQDQHSLWNDTQENLWKLETIEKNRLKFVRPNLHSAPRPQEGILSHNQNAINQEPIIIKKSYNEATNPFYNTETEQIDFAHYCTLNGIQQLDAVYIFLGANHFWENISIELSQLCKNIVAMGNELVSHIKKVFPDVHIKVMGVPLISQNGGAGFNYGTMLPNSDAYQATRFAMELNLAYENWTHNAPFTNMDFINLASQFDAEYNYPCMQKPVNARSTQTERIDTNAAHPTNDGYMQIADAVYRNIVATFCKE